MPVTLTDATAGAQRIASSNSGGIELGTATAGGTISVRGKSMLAGSNLAANTLPSGAVARYTGSVSATSRNLTTVTTGPVAGFGTITGGSGGVSGPTIVAFFDTGFSCALRTATASVTTTCSYSVF